MNFFHRLFNPHCADCELNLRCESCDTLRVQLEVVNQQNRELLKTIVELTKPEEVMMRAPNNEVVIQPIQPKHVPWQIRRELLEATDRQAAAALKERQAEIEKNKVPISIKELERELGVDNETDIDDIDSPSVASN